jgi:hypothetical protein
VPFRKTRILRNTNLVDNTKNTPSKSPYKIIRRSFLFSRNFGFKIYRKPFCSQKFRYKCRFDLCSLMYFSRKKKSSSKFERLVPNRPDIKGIIRRKKYPPIPPYTQALARMGPYRPEKIFPCGRLRSNLYFWTGKSLDRGAIMTGGTPFPTADLVRARSFCGAGMMDDRCRRNTITHGRTAGFPFRSATISDY